MKGSESKKRKRRSQRDYNLAFKIQVVSQVEKGEMTYKQAQRHYGCLLYTSDAADERSSVDLGGRRIIKKKKNKTNHGVRKANIK